MLIGDSQQQPLFLFVLHEQTNSLAVETQTTRSRRGTGTELEAELVWRKIMELNLLMLVVDNE